MFFNCAPDSAKWLRLAEGSICTTNLFVSQVRFEDVTLTFSTSEIEIPISITSPVTPKGGICTTSAVAKVCALGKMISSSTTLYRLVRIQEGRVKIFRSIYCPKRFRPLLKPFSGVRLKTWPKALGTIDNFYNPLLPPKDTRKTR